MLARYVAGLPEESVSAALVFGTGIHAAIEDFYRAELAGEAKPDVDQLMFAYRRAWLPHEPDKIQFGSTETRGSLDALAGKMLTAFLNSPTASVQGRVLGVEEEIRGTLVEGVPDLYGRIDLVTEDDDRLVLTDFKTSRGKWSTEQAEDAGEQLVLYSKLAGELAPVIDVRGPGAGHARRAVDNPRRRRIPVSSTSPIGCPTGSSVSGQSQRSTANSRRMASGAQAKGGPAAASVCMNAAASFPPGTSQEARRRS